MLPPKLPAEKGKLCAEIGKQPENGAFLLSKLLA
jgi:hypothetical protein